MRPTLLTTEHPNIVALWKDLHEDYDLALVGQNPNLAKEMGLEHSLALAQFNNSDRNETAINLTYQFAVKLQDHKISSSTYLRVISECLKEDFGEEYESLAPPQLLPSRLKEWWPAMVGEHLRQHVMLVEMLKGLKSETKLAGVLVHEDVTPDMRVIVSFAKANKIPVIHVPHANCFYTGSSWDIHTESISDYIAASGQFGADFYTHWGFNRDNITITGAPALGSWYTKSSPSKEQARQVLGVDKDAYLIVYASTWGQLTSSRGQFDNEFQQNIDLICEVAKSSRATLCVKMHPGEGQGQENMYLNALKTKGVNGFITRSYNEYVLHAADVLVSHGPSNINIQAAIIGLPSCYLPTEDFSFPPNGPLCSDKTVESLHDTIERARKMDKSYWNAFAQQMNDAHNSHEDKSAADRITAMVKEICV